MQLSKSSFFRFTASRLSIDSCSLLALASSSGEKSNKFTSSFFFFVLNALNLRPVASFLALDRLFSFLSVDYPPIDLRFTTPADVLYMLVLLGDLDTRF